MDEGTRVGVLDKSVAILDALELGPLGLADLAATTAIPRPTAHRLATALEAHGLLARDDTGRFLLGPRLRELAGAVGAERLAVLARPVLIDLRDATGESAQLYVRQHGQRICIAAADLSSGLRDTVPVGAVLTMAAGSAAQVLAAWPGADDQLPARTAFSAPTLAAVRRRGWAESVGEREPGVASVSAPVRDDGRAIAAVSLSGPIERLGRSPGKRHARAVAHAAHQLSEAVSAERP